MSNKIQINKMGSKTQIERIGGIGGTSYYKKQTIILMQNKFIAYLRHITARIRGTETTLDLRSDGAIARLLDLLGLARHAPSVHRKQRHQRQCREHHQQRHAEIHLRHLTGVETRHKRQRRLVLGVIVIVRIGIERTFSVQKRAIAERVEAAHTQIFEPPTTTT